MSISVEVTFPRTIPGTALVAAACRAASTPDTCPVNRDGKDPESQRRVGQTGGSPHAHLAVTAVGCNTLNPRRAYRRVEVVPHRWTGPTRSVVYSPAIAECEARAYAERLRKELLAYTAR